MTFDRNPKPVQFILPNVLDRASLSVGKDDGFADQFGLRLTVLTQNRRCTKLHRHRLSMFEPTAAQPRGLFQRSVASNSRSQSICALRLAGSSGSGFSDARNLSP